MKRARRLCLERLLTALLGIGFAALRLGAQSFEIVHSFGPNGTGSPIGSLVLLADGTLIGVTEGSGRFGQGTVFALTPDGMGGFSSVVLHDFAGFDGLKNSAEVLPMGLNQPDVLLDGLAVEVFGLGNLFCPLRKSAG